ncbi:MAG: hypothetical protein IKG14_04385 [Clostridia bacterium]|nr:hypothetical protein [Clostridia bacterium]
MSGKKPNLKMMTVERLIKNGFTKDKQVMEMKIEDLPKLGDYKRVDINNIIEIRETISSLKSKDENGVMGFLSKLNNPNENTN